MRNVSKSFQGVQALRKVSFVLETGEVHGLVGANGAGKSTFIRMLSGASTPDAGDIEVQGLPISFEDPRAQRNNGIAAIYQELTIIPEMSALSNVFLGEVPNRWFVVDRRGMEKRFNELAEWMGVKTRLMRRPRRYRSPISRCLKSCARSTPSMMSSSWMSRRRRWVRSSVPGSTT